MSRTPLDTFIACALRHRIGSCPVNIKYVCRFLQVSLVLRFTQVRTVSTTNETEYRPYKNQFERDCYGKYIDQRCRDLVWWSLGNCRVSRLESQLRGPKVVVEGKNLRWKVEGRKSKINVKFYCQPHDLIRS
jgi:hypothetical protein